MHTYVAGCGFLGPTLVNCLCFIEKDKIVKSAELLTVYLSKTKSHDGIWFQVHCSVALRCSGECRLFWIYLSGQSCGHVHAIASWHHNKWFATLSHSCGCCRCRLSHASPNMQSHMYVNVNITKCAIASILFLSHKLSRALFIHRTRCWAGKVRTVHVSGRTHAADRPVRWHFLIHQNEECNMFACYHQTKLNPDDSSKGNSRSYHHIEWSPLDFSCAVRTQAHAHSSSVPPNDNHRSRLR